MSEKSPIGKDGGVTMLYVLVVAVAILQLLVLAKLYTMAGGVASADCIARCASAQ